MLVNGSVKVRGISCAYLSGMTKAEGGDEITAISAQLQGKYGWTFILAQINRRALMHTIPKILQCIQNLQFNAGNLLRMHEKAILGLEKVQNLSTVYFGVIEC